MSSSNDWHTADNVEDLWEPTEDDMQPYGCSTGGWSYSDYEPVYGESPLLYHGQTMEDAEKHLRSTGFDFEPTCVRCEAEINPDEVFCGKCYDYLDERGYFEP